MTKLWQDKTDEEFKNDIMKMVEEGKLTKWDPWDHIKTLDEAKNYVEAIYEEWDQESQAANDCIVEILESYLQFVNVTERTIKCFAELPEKYETMFDMLVKKVRNKWTPILETAVKKQNKKPRKSAKKSA